MTNIIWN